MYRNRYQRLSDFISYKIKSCVHSIVLVLWNKGEEGLLYIYLLHVIQSNKFWTQFQILNVFYLIFHILTHVLAGLSGILHYCKLSGISEDIICPNISNVFTLSHLHNQILFLQQILPICLIIPNKHEVRQHVVFV